MYSHATWDGKASAGAAGADLRRIAGVTQGTLPRYFPIHAR
jgi:hypothetical protein